MAVHPAKRFAKVSIFGTVNSLIFILLLICIIVFMRLAHEENKPKYFAKIQKKFIFV